MMKKNNFLLMVLLAIVFVVVWGANPAFAEQKCVSYIGPDGNEVKDCVEVDNEGNAVGGVMKGCIPLPMKLEEDIKCIFCPLFKTLYVAAQDMSKQAIQATAIPVRNVMALGFAILMTFMVLGHVSSLTKQDAPKFITGLLTASFKFLVAFILLTTTDTIYNYVINPLLATALEFGGSMLFNASSALKECSISNTKLTGILPMELYTRMECFIKGVQKEIAFAQSAGSSLMCVGRKEASGAFGIWDFSMVASGLIIYLAALLLSFAFAFYLIDSVVMLGVIGAMMTFFIACWPFKLTTGYSSKGFNMFMNVFFVFIFMGIVVSINTQLIKAALESGGLSDLQASLSGNDIDKSKKTLDINGVGFLIVLCCCFFGFKFSAKSAQLAGNMAGGGGMDIGAKLGGLMTSGATNAAMKIGKGAAQPVINKAKQVGSAAASWGKNKLAQGAKFVRNSTAPLSKMKMGSGSKDNPQSTYNSGVQPANNQNPNQAMANQAMANQAPNEPVSSQQTPEPSAQNQVSANQGTGGGDATATPNNSQNAQPMMMKTGQGGPNVYNQAAQAQNNAKPFVASINQGQAAQQAASFQTAAPDVQKEMIAQLQSEVNQAAANYTNAALAEVQAQTQHAMAMGTPGEAAAQANLTKKSQESAGAKNRLTQAQATYSSKMPKKGGAGANPLTAQYIFDASKNNQQASGQLSKEYIDSIVNSGPRGSEGPAAAQTRSETNPPPKNNSNTGSTPQEPKK